MTRLTDDDIRRGLDLAERATPGEWSWAPQEPTLTGRRSLSSYPLSAAVVGPTGEALWNAAYRQGARQPDRDAEFIALARTMLPSLAAELLALRELVKDMLLFHDGPCRFDHNGFCQEHMCDEPCIIGRAQELIHDC